MSESRKERLKIAKLWLKTLDKDLNLIEIRNLYKEKFNVDNICAYKELAILGNKDALKKVNTRKENLNCKKIKKQKETDVEELEVLIIYDINDVNEYYFHEIYDGEYFDLTGIKK